jgi:hypothetical protein
VTAQLPDPSEAAQSKVLPSWEPNRLHHDQQIKYVDASPCTSVQGDYSPVTGKFYQPAKALDNGII